MVPSSYSEALGEGLAISLLASNRGRAGSRGEGGCWVLYLFALTIEFSFPLLSVLGAPSYPGPPYNPATPSTEEGARGSKMEFPGSQT